jgi:hypothetical protein
MVAINDPGRAEGGHLGASIEFGSLYVGVTDPMFLRRRPPARAVEVADWVFDLQDGHLGTRNRYDS